MTFWTPLVCFAVLMIMYTVGDVISVKTKGIVSSLIIVIIIAIAGSWTGLLPASLVIDSGLPVVLTTFGQALLITSLGTIIDLNQLVAQWKTVVVVLFGLIGIGVMAFTLGTMFFGREYALAASPPIAGGIVAATIVANAATAANRGDIAAYAMMVMTMQMLISMPICSILLRREAKAFVAKGLHKQEAAADSGKQLNLRIVPELPKEYQTSAILLGKIALVAAVAVFVAKLTMIPDSVPTRYILDPNIAYLLFGILFCEIGFLEKNLLVKANAQGIIMMSLMVLAVNNFLTLSPQKLFELLVPTAGMLVLGAVGIAIFSGLSGWLLFKMPLNLSISVGLTAMMGYPGTQVVSDEVIKGISLEGDYTDTEIARLRGYILPKMLVGGFTSVTIASVVFAGIVAPMLF